MNGRPDIGTRRNESRAVQRKKWLTEKGKEEIKDNKKMKDIKVMEERQNERKKMKDKIKEEWRKDRMKGEMKEKQSERINGRNSKWMKKML